MSFDPQNPERSNPAGLAGMRRQFDGRWVSYADYAQLLSLLHDVSTEADPAGTLAELRLLQEAYAAQERVIEELNLSVEQLVEQVRAAVTDYNNELKRRRGLEAEMEMFKGEGNG